ncbi:mortality factor 4-like protein 1 [Eurytemora carolleeae]|uniref:mortality factor 4-like protein 1 n=1 Tax=Eurytemora carolleeae TaxID=1294199 RepID=UPI000C771DEB|nr:mortality factor 4-like protein 1 [Eurytemora carolleeae]|eukprot:XP_023326394.1 mortality factor 4-like protein 1 [Eurytemora affinis]
MEDKNVVKEVMDLSDADPSPNAKVIDKKDLKVEEDEERNAEKPEAMVPVEKWNSGEKILCFHGPLIYEAKIQTVEVQNGVYKYFIHYHGWNKSWDEWVPEARMLKHTEKNKSIQQDLIRAHEEKNNEKRRRILKRKNEDLSEVEVDPVKSSRPEHIFAIPAAPSPNPRPRRKAGLRPQKREVKSSVELEENEVEEDEEYQRNRSKIAETLKPPDNTVESEEIFKSKVEIRVRIPDELKSYIVDDWEQITRNNCLCSLPAKLTVHQLLDNYARAKTNKSESASKNNKEKAIVEVTAGLREYFNVMLPTQLLFKQERDQYQKMKVSDSGLVPTKIYGTPHLLRLFTKLGEYLVYTPLGEKTISLLQIYLQDILNYMKKNSSIIFSNSDYYSLEKGEPENNIT